MWRANAGVCQEWLKNANAISLNFLCKQQASGQRLSCDDDFHH